MRFGWSKLSFNFTCRFKGKGGLFYFQAKLSKTAIISVFLPSYAQDLLGIAIISCPFVLLTLYPLHRGSLLYHLYNHLLLMTSSIAKTYSLAPSQTPNLPTAISTWTLLAQNRHLQIPLPICSVSWDCYYYYYFFFGILADKWSSPQLSKPEIWESSSFSLTLPYQVLYWFCLFFNMDILCFILFIHPCCLCFKNLACSTIAS